MIWVVNSPDEQPKSDAPLPAGEGTAADVADLAHRYSRVRQMQSFLWDSKYGGMCFVGRGGQGIVFRCERTGVDGFGLPLALKVFAPDVYASVEDYESDMRRIASVAKRIARLQNHHLLDVHNFIEQDRIRIMVMEWVNGYDLTHLLSSKTLARVRARISGREWSRLSDVVVTEGPEQARLKPGIAIQILRECLAGLASLHRAGVAHGDIKPGNVMVKRTGSVKLVDFGSAVDMAEPGSRIAATPAYAAPEILEGASNSPQSDLASLGYMLVEMLSGGVLFRQADSIEELLLKKKGLRDRLTTLLPPDVVRNRDLLALCRHLVHPDPAERMGSAEEANIGWAANLHRQLVKTDLDSEYENDLRLWMESLPADFPTTLEPHPTGTGDLRDGDGSDSETTVLL